MRLGKGTIPCCTVDTDRPVPGCRSLKHSLHNVHILVAAHCHRPHDCNAYLIHDSSAVSRYRAAVMECSQYGGALGSGDGARGADARRVDVDTGAGDTAILQCLSIPCALGDP